MGEYNSAKAAFFSRGVTLNSLRDELHALNMRMLLAMQNHDEAEQGALKKQTAEVQEKIDRMSPADSTGRR